MPTVRLKRWSRYASWSKATRSCLRSSSSARRANAAVQKYLNAKKVPQLLAATGASRFSDPQNAPWTIGFNPNYQTEGRIYGKYILTNYPNAKIGILYQNDDLGPATTSPD